MPRAGPRVARRGLLRAAVIVTLAFGLIIVTLTLSSSQETSASSANAQCQAATDLNRRRHDQDPVTRGSSTMAVLGDSFAQGVGLADPRAQSWPTLAGRALNRTTIVNAVGSTGFANPGFCGGQDYSTRIRQVLATRPTTVVVQGGLNDSTLGEQRLRGGALATLKGLRGVPTVLVVGPTASPATDRAKVERVDAILRDVAEAERRPYLSALDWQLPYVSDGLHPTLEGQREYAERIVESLTGPDL